MGIVMAAKYKQDESADLLGVSEVADLLGVSKETMRRWDNNGKLVAERHPINNYRVYRKEQLRIFDQVSHIFDEDEGNFVEPNRRYKVIELFSGAGGLALGLEQAGFETILLNDFDKWACETLKHNRPDWNVIEGDVRNLELSQYKGKVDAVFGGFPCQAFSYAGKKLGFQDARGTMFYEFARIVNEVRPPICVAENVRGLLSHDNGRTIDGIVSILKELGYKPILPPKILKAIFYRVPQKRERVFIVAVREDIHVNYAYPRPYNKIYSLKDALKKGELYTTDVKQSAGTKYPEKKRKVLDLVPPGGYWRDLPIDVQRQYMMKSFYLGGGKTGMARRMSWDEPCLTLTCNPAQKQTERCHPDETRPFSVREYARIQTFPDDWDFQGPVSEQYKQIGNAVPVNLAKEVGYSVIDFLNKYDNMRTREKGKVKYSFAK